MKSLLFAGLLAVALGYPDGAGVCTYQDIPLAVQGMPNTQAVGFDGLYTIQTSLPTYFLDTGDQTGEAAVTVSIVGPTFNGFVLWGQSNVTGGGRFGYWYTEYGTTVSGHMPPACSGFGTTLTHSNALPKGGPGTPFVVYWDPPNTPPSPGNSPIVFQAIILTTSGMYPKLHLAQSAVINRVTTVPYPPEAVTFEPRWNGAIVYIGTTPNGGAKINSFAINFNPVGGGSAIPCNCSAPLCQGFTIQCYGLPNGVAFTVSVQGVNTIGNGGTFTTVSAVTPGCFCNGHSTTCDSTGTCQNCQGYTQGALCDQCVAGYTGDPVYESCGPAPAPHPGSATTLHGGVAALLAFACWVLAQLL